MSEPLRRPGAPFDRRTALRLLGASGVWLGLSGCSSDGPGADLSPTESSSSLPTTSDAARTTDLPATGTDVLPPEAPSVGPSLDDGPVHLRLWAEPSTAQIEAGTETEVWSFGAEVIDGDPAAVASSDSYLGPTLHVRQGQSVKISFENRLPDQPSIVHWHGLVVPQDQDGQPPEAVSPGETYEYEFVVANEPGTYWYHPHPHQLTGEQVYRGLAGLLVVHGAEDHPDSALPSGTNDIALVLQDRSIGGDGQLRYIANRHDQMAGFVGDTLVTNGRSGYAVTVRPEPYRIRILNGANSRTQYLTWSTGDSIQSVATDGALLPAPVTSPGLLITPAQRADLWVDFSAHPAGTQVDLLSANVFVEGGMGGGMGSARSVLDLDGDVAATFVVGDGTPQTGTLPDQLGESPDLDPADAVNADAPKQFVLSTFRATHWINDAVWEGRAAAELETVSAGTVELWEFVNRSPMIHPMHLHGNAFRVVAREWHDDGLADAWSSIADGIVETGWRDTVVVFPGQTVRIAVPFAEHLGYFLYHCHILEHEDQGMMRNFHVL